MSKIVSIKRVPQDDSDPVFEIAKKELGSLAEHLLASKMILSYNLTHDNDLKLELCGVSSNTKFEIYIYPGGEVFSRRINGYYETFQAAYDIEEKKSLVHEFAAEAKKYFNEKHKEIIYENKGKIIYRKLFYPDNTSETTSAVFAGRIRKYFGATKKETKF